MNCIETINEAIKLLLNAENDMLKITILDIKTHNHDHTDDLYLDLELDYSSNAYQSRVNIVCKNLYKNASFETHVYLLASDYYDEEDKLKFIETFINKLIKSIEEKQKQYDEELKIREIVKSEIEKVIKDLK